MNIETLRQHCLTKPGTTESFPFDNDTLVFKVLGKIYALVSIEEPDSVNLKCDPEYALELREKHPDEVFPGYHMNKKHWNTVSFLGNLSDRLILHLVNHSYELVVSKLPKRERNRLKSS